VEREGKGEGRKIHTHTKGGTWWFNSALPLMISSRILSFGMELQLLFIVKLGGREASVGFEVSNGETQPLQPELTSRGSNQCIYQNSYFLSSNLIPVFDSLVFFFPCVSNHTGTNPVSMIFFSNWFCAFFCFWFAMCIFVKQYTYNKLKTKKNVAIGLGREDELELVVRFV
jgi:hypothetical protein